MRAMFDAETQIAKELEQSLTREKQSYEFTKQEFLQAEKAYETLTLEKDRMLSEIEKYQNDSADMAAQLNGYVESSTGLQKQVNKIKKDYIDQQNNYQTAQKTLQNAQSEYQQLRKDLQSAEITLEQHKVKGEALAKQLAVQTTMTNNEKEKIKNVTLASKSYSENLNQQGLFTNVTSLPRKNSTTSIASNYAALSSSQPALQIMNRDAFGDMKKSTSPVKMTTSQVSPTSFSQVASPMNAPEGNKASPTPGTTTHPVNNSVLSPPATKNVGLNISASPDFKAVFPSIDELDISFNSAPAPSLPPRATKPTGDLSNFDKKQDVITKGPVTKNSIVLNQFDLDAGIFSTDITQKQLKTANLEAFNTNNFEDAFKFDSSFSSQKEPVKTTGIKVSRQDPFASPNTTRNFDDAFKTLDMSPTKASAKLTFDDVFGGSTNVPSQMEVKKEVMPKTSTLNIIPSPTKEVETREIRELISMGFTRGTVY